MRRAIICISLVTGLALAAGCASGPSLKRVRPLEYQKRLIVAVSDLQNRTGDEAYDPLLDELSGILIADLHETECFRLIERQRLASILEEMKLGMTGLLDPEKTREVGKMIGADAILFVNLASVKFGSQKSSAIIATAIREKVETTLDARLVSVDKGEILAASKVTIPYSNFYGSAYFGLMKHGDKADPKQVVQEGLAKSLQYLARELAWQVSKMNK